MVSNQEALRVNMSGGTLSVLELLKIPGNDKCADCENHGLYGFLQPFFALFVPKF